jgi:hypothetical protein
MFFEIFSTFVITSSLLNRLSNIRGEQFFCNFVILLSHRTPVLQLIIKGKNFPRDKSGPAPIRAARAA